MNIIINLVTVPCRAAAPGRGRGPAAVGGPRIGARGHPTVRNRPHRDPHHRVPPAGVQRHRQRRHRGEPGRLPFAAPR
eukprot:1651510-Pyramimonas_sp.AAC.1